MEQAGHGGIQRIPRKVPYVLSIFEQKVPSLDLASLYGHMEIVNLNSDSDIADGFSPNHLRTVEVLKLGPPASSEAEVQ